MQQHHSIRALKDECITLLQSGNLSELITRVNANSILGSHDSELQALRAFVCVQEHKLDQAQALLTAIQGGTTDYPVLAKQTQALLDGLRLESSCLSALKENPDDSSAIYKLAGYYERTGRFDQSLELYDRLVDAVYQDELSVMRPYLIGVGHFNLQNEALAKQNFLAALSVSLTPKTAQALKRAAHGITALLAHRCKPADAPKLSVEPSATLTYPFEVAETHDANLFFIWTTTADSLDPVYLACVHQAALIYPQSTIYVLSNSLAQTELPENVQRVPYKLADIIKDTPLENWKPAQESNSCESPFWFSHQTDVMRYALLYKYGGIYLDTDAFLLKKLGPELQNALSHESKTGTPPLLAAGLLCFSPRNPFIEACLEQIPFQYDPADWGCIGPNLVTNVYHSQSFSKEEVTIQPQEIFYPVTCDMPFSFTDTMGPGEKKVYDGALKNSVQVHLFGSSLKNYNKDGRALPRIISHPGSFLDTLYTHFGHQKFLYTTLDYVTDKIQT